MRRAVVILLSPVGWSPPGTDPATWRAALAEDMVDLLATLSQLEPAIAAAAEDLPLARSIAWPDMPIHTLPEASVSAALSAVAADGYDQAAVLAADAPDLPGLLIGKLLRPITTRPVAVAPAHGGGLLGVAARLPAPDWLPPLELTADPELLRAAAPRRALVAVTPAWHRLRGPADLAALDPAVEGWETTRSLLTAG
ncbi:hypothetical protein O7623_26795 [Solwaraspora sp. WMMD791]|uniref:hypothetical protein n=1 Tax=Solwaraspora sp. WMMD791 TaxID=3016086 RepID=UPI00249CA9AE|nr:hypothetical protein [Solwaraspora sp. WMMD791]WFE26841.1 hypothetical protein O7623_26795 [Solwaraspora sp. WMMD791]